MQKKLSLMMLIALVTGNMIGSGIFLLPSNLANIGTVTLFSWVFTAIGAICLALVFSDMSQTLPRTGGPYAYARAELGEFLGFQTAYTYWIAIWVGNTAITIALIGYAQIFFPQLQHPWLATTFAISIVWLLTFINIFGVRAAGSVQFITTLLKLIPIIIIGLFGWQHIHLQNYTQSFNVTQPHYSTLHAISIGAALTFWAFIGLESASVPAGSVDNPQRNIPLATIIGTSLAAFVYILTSAVIMGMFPASHIQHSASPFAEAADKIFGPWGEHIVAVAAIISCLGALNGWILVQGQVSLAAAKDHLFPQIFAKENKRAVPAYGLIIAAICISILLIVTSSKNIVAQFKVVILLAVLANVTPYFMTATANLLLLAKKSTKPKHIKRKMLIASAAMFFAFWAIISAGKSTVYYGALLIFSSIPLYAWHLYLHHRYKLFHTKQ